MIPVLLFPQIDPVIVQIGPFGIRWYAIAYIAGLVLGWRSMRWLVTMPPAVATPLQVDDFLTWATMPAPTTCGIRDLATRGSRHSPP